MAISRDFTPSGDGAPGSDPVTAVALRHVRFRYPGAGEDALRVESFTVGAGEHVFVRGPSGCGKTTLLSLIAGVLVASQGAVSVRGRDWASLSSAGRDRLRADHIGYIFQQFNLLPYLSVIDNVLLPCRFSVARTKRAAAGASTFVARAEALLAQMGLGQEFLHRQASALSVGQQQRVAAARALIGQPELVVADEPTSALDEAVRESFMRVLLEACSEARSALVFVSHDARLARRFGRQVDLPTLNRASPALVETAQA
jgi:putative ABC transport system ATP-binding protein